MTRVGTNNPARAMCDRRPDVTTIDFVAVNRAAGPALPALLQHWLPQGQRNGNEWVARNPRRVDRSPGSFKVNLRTGRWADFATGDKGGDIISLVAYLDQVSQAEAARRVARHVGLSRKEVARG